MSTILKPSPPPEKQTIFQGIPFPSVHRYEQSFYKLPEPKYIPPTKPEFMDIFRGKDDEDYLKKTLRLTSYSAAGVGWILIVDLTVGSAPTTLAGAVSRVGVWGVPIVGGGIAYTTAVCIAGSLRKKSDQTNHIIGGIALGSVFGAARRTMVGGFAASVFLGIVGALFKESTMAPEEGGFEMFGDSLPPRRGFAFSHKMDFTRVDKTPGNWYTDPTPQPYPEVAPSYK